MSIRTLRSLLLVLALQSAAYSHAILLSVVPGVNAVVRGPDVPVRLRFNSRIDLKRSRLTLIRPDGTQHALVLAGQTSPDMLISDVKGLSRGSYALQWQVLASDGHITRGEERFRVE